MLTGYTLVTRLEFLAGRDLWRICWHLCLIPWKWSSVLILVWSWLYCRVSFLFYLIPTFLKGTTVNKHYYFPCEDSPVQGTLSAGFSAALRTAPLDSNFKKENIWRRGEAW